MEAVIQEFIDAGEPVSSGSLYERYNFGIKPAMIRLELDSLEDEGFLEQPHHSAGRVPTDNGYELFVKKLLGIEVPAPEPRQQHSMHELFEERAWPDLLHRLSAELGLLSIAADLSHEMVYKSGLDNLVKHLDWQDREEINSVIRDFEEVDERLPRATEKWEEGPKIFIGKKSPVTRSESLSVIGANYRVGDDIISILAIGPKRMDYKKTIRIFRSL